MNTYLQVIILNNHVNYKYTSTKTSKERTNQIVNRGRQQSKKFQVKTVMTERGLLNFLEV